MDPELSSLVGGWLGAHMDRREMLKRLSALGLSMPLASAVLAACATGTSTSSSTSTTSSKPKLTVSIVQEPTTMDIVADATASIALTLRDNLYEGLVRMDSGGAITPSLAKSWDVSADGRTVTFHLQSGVKWHDGSPFTAADVKWSWDRAGDAATKPANPHKDYWKPVTSVDVVDDHTVKVTLAAYSDNWLFHMTSGSAAIISQKSNATNAANPVGTGPFKFGSWNRGSSLALTRNDGYWGQKAKLKDIEFRFIKDPNSQNSALQAGDIDAIGQVGGPEQLAAFKSNSQFKVLTGEAFGKIMVSLNNGSGPTKDVKIRKAINMAIDKKAWIDGIQAGYAKPIGSHSAPNPGEPYYVDENGVNPYDPAKAKQLVADAGFGSGLTLRLAQISAFPYAVRGTDILVSQLKAIGITVKVEPMEFAIWLKSVFTGGDYDMTIINHIEERDIANYANPKYYWRYSNSQVADWLTKADAEPDKAKRNALYAQVEKQLADDAANAWVMSPNALAVTKANLHEWPIQGISPALFFGNTYFS